MPQSKRFFFQYQSSMFLIYTERGGPGECSSSVIGLSFFCDDILQTRIMSNCFFFH